MKARRQAENSATNVGLAINGKNCRAKDRGATLKPPRRRETAANFPRILPVLGLEADAAPQFGAVVHDAVGDDEFNLANIVDGF
jgi:hypothetical protein